MISPLHTLALDSDVCPVPVTCPVAPLNTYTFLNKVLVLYQYLVPYWYRIGTVLVT